MPVAGSVRPMVTGEEGTFRSTSTGIVRLFSAICVKEVAVPSMVVALTIMRPTVASSGTLVSAWIVMSPIGSPTLATSGMSAVMTAVMVWVPTIGNWQEYCRVRDAGAAIAAPLAANRAEAAMAELSRSFLCFSMVFMGFPLVCLKFLVVMQTTRRA